MSWAGEKLYYIKKKTKPTKQNTAPLSKVFAEGMLRKSIEQNIKFYMKRLHNINFVNSAASDIKPPTS